jgi:aryl-alcohol dehydrogenase-like predicted oxidoreductase
MKLSLGTAQFGLSYGVSNVYGKTSKNNVKKILKYAHKAGVRVLDTAPAYGNSEIVTGELINTASDHWDIVTKTPYFEDNVISSQQINELFDSFKLSQNKLGKKNIYGLLVHNCDNLFLPGGDGLLEAMIKLKDEGFIKKIGVSLYNSEQIDRVLDNYSIDLVQLPVSILDQRLLSGHQLKKLKKYGVEIHARSIFLQGLLLMSVRNIPTYLEGIQTALNAFHTEAKKQNISALQLAFGFVQSISEVDKIIVGVNTLNQLHEIIGALPIRVNTTELSNLSIDDPLLLNPSNWKI